MTGDSSTAPGNTGIPVDADSSLGARRGSPRRHEAWQPRVQKDAPFNAFETDERSPDSRPGSSTIRDPSRDTAPLQGQKDLSDDDSLANEYSPNQDEPVISSETARNNRSTQS
jgi:hypothetical protein